MSSNVYQLHKNKYKLKYFHSQIFWVTLRQLAKNGLQAKKWVKFDLSSIKGLKSGILPPKSNCVKAVKGQFLDLTALWFPPCGKLKLSVPLYMVRRFQAATIKSIII